MSELNARKEAMIYIYITQDVNLPFNIENKPKFTMIQLLSVYTISMTVSYTISLFASILDSSIFLTFMLLGGGLTILLQLIILLKKNKLMRYFKSIGQENFEQSIEKLLNNN
ncbi:MAG: hypothetical protein COB67_00465 [SAR324 cluster bacterium]|uniref:Uncharacterized protein n=1 Tax=SAR324 cluster bacterium TaxID=2024889 RepID=A0A2A4TC79_9DELT|nr:MAG: hypothetical protein COB67_00465 [SAR324 cluster bacterium]